MQCYDYWKDIIIPLLSALIGGFVTMLGVIITIKWESKKEKKKRVDAAKPWLYSLSEYEENNYEKANQIQLVAEDDDYFSVKNNGNGIIVIKNASNVVGLVDSLQTDRVLYKPCFGKILDKNDVTWLIVYLKDKEETLTNMRLSISDIYGNKYEYAVAQNENQKSWIIHEIIKEKD